MGSASLFLSEGAMVSHTTSSADVATSPDVTTCGLGDEDADFPLKSTADCIVETGPTIVVVFELRITGGGIAEISFMHGIFLGDSIATADVASLISGGTSTVVLFVSSLLISMLADGFPSPSEGCSCDCGAEHCTKAALQNTLLAAAAILLSDELSSCLATSLEIFVPLMAHK